MKVFLWGTGLVADEVMQRCNTLENYELLGFVDNNSEKWGDSFWGIEIFPPSILKTVEADKIVILNSSYDAIREQIVEEYPQYSNCIENRYFFYKESILKRYANSEDSEKPEIREVIDYIKKNGLSVFNYEFAKNYLKLDVAVHKDVDCGLYYVMHNGHRMYFSKEYNSEQAVQKYYRSILVEQDIDSPHRYLSGDFDVHKGDIVVDAGVAEGNFSLDIIDRAKHIYIVEADSDWIEALQHTFWDYRDKVTIVKGFVSSYDDGPFVTLDSMIREDVNFIKMDIEGNEWDALKGATKLINRSPRLKMAICAYHNDFDQILIESVLDELKIRHDTTRGVMWFPGQSRQACVSTRFCKGLIRAYKGID